MSSQPDTIIRTMHHLGSTRGTSHRDFLLQTPDTMVRTPLPGLTHGMAIVHVAPAMGAGFALSTLEFGPGGALTHAPAQRFVYVLEGELALQLDGTSRHTLHPGGFAFLPAEMAHVLQTPAGARVVMIEKHAESAMGLAPSPTFLVGREEDIEPAALNGDPGVQVRSLLPASPEFDFAVNTMTYVPGASLSQVEVHYMEHGLLMLEGGGIYRVGDAWHPVQRGDAIWMAPFCPQWFGAIGKGNAKYLIYKNFNRHVLG